MWDGKQPQTAKHQVLFTCALEVSLGLLSLLRCDLDTAAHWWAVAMETCHNAGHSDLFIGLCRLLLPWGPDSLSRLQQEATAIYVLVNPTLQGVKPTCKN